MITPRTLEEQVEAARGDDLRILVVGAGMAGLTAAQLLRGQGKHPILIERSTAGNDSGYMLALMPMVDRALDELGVRDEYRARSTPFDRYGLHDRRGRLARMDPMSGVLSGFGDYRGIARGELAATLASGGCPITFDTRVTAIDQRPDGATVTLTTEGREEAIEADLVIVADGIHSATRSLVLGTDEVQTLDTGWGGWVAWADPDDDMDLGEELWGAGFFVGVYPVKDGLGAFVGGPVADLGAGPASLVAGIRSRLRHTSPRLASTLAALEADRGPFFWAFTDCRSARWVTGRTVLVGDAAAGFLPTAGVGAGMAMESAWMLASLLRNADPRSVDTLLAAFERVQRPRVESAQDNSRSLARMMFRRSTALAVVRDVAMRLVSVKVALGPIQKTLDSQPDPAAVAADALREPARA